MRLVQMSRRFLVEIQPQLVLLQKTLLNIEGLGRELDPELDLWATAKPFLEKWMLGQVGPQKFLEQLKAQAPHYAKLLPELPMLLHGYLKRGPELGGSDKLVAELLQEQKRTNRMLQWMLGLGIGFAIGVGLMLVMPGLRHY